MDIKLNNVHIIGAQKNKRGAEILFEEIMA